MNGYKEKMKDYSQGKIIACIIVRMKSKRLPGKALADINGKTMTERIIERLRAAKTVDQIVICTSTHKDDQILVNMAKNVWGVEVFAGSELNVLSRMISSADMLQADDVIRVTGDNPFTDTDYIDWMVEKHLATRAEYTRIIGLPEGVTAEIMSNDMLVKLHKLMADTNQSEYLTIFAFDPNIFKCTILDAKTEHYRPYYSLSIDTPDDLDLARNLYKIVAPDGGMPSLTEVIKELDSDPCYKGRNPTDQVKISDNSFITYEEAINRINKLAEIAKRNM